MEFDNTESANKFLLDNDCPQGWIDENVEIINRMKNNGHKIS